RKSSPTSTVIATIPSRTNMKRIPTTSVCPCSRRTMWGQRLLCMLSPFLTSYDDLEECKPELHAREYAVNSKSTNGKGGLRRPGDHRRATCEVWDPYRCWGPPWRRLGAVLGRETTSHRILADDARLHELA